MSLVGGNIDDHCRKCNLLLAHIVLYKVDGKVSKVKCKTCGAEHRYRGEKAQERHSDAGKKIPLKKAIAKRNASTGADVIRWKGKHDSMDPALSIKDYRTQDIYHAEDVIRHPVFGVGFVEKIVSETRMDVLFEDALKLMAMNHPQK